MDGAPAFVGAEREELVLELLFGGPFGHGEGEEQDAAEAQFAVFGGIPLGLGVRAAAVAAGTDG